MCAFSLVCVSAEFGTLGGMLISYSRYVHTFGAFSLGWGGASGFSTLGGMLIGYSC